MNKLLTLMITAILLVGAGCGEKSAATSNNKPNSATTENKTTAAPSPSTSAASTSGAASATVKQIYDLAIKRDCAAIPPLLTDEFKKAVGTSKDELDALCDSFTDSGKITSVEVKSEDVKGDAATVKISQTFKDGKKEEKTENMKKSADGKWLMDS